MKSDSKTLANIVSSWEGVPITVYGDLIVDHYIWGQVERISPEAPVVVVKVKEEEYRPGGAGNVANNLAGLGAAVQLCGVVGNDTAGRQIGKQLQNCGVAIDGMLVDDDRPTTIKSRVVAHAQQVVRVDREVTNVISSDRSSEMIERLQAATEKSKAVVVSDYGKGAVSKEVWDALVGDDEAGVFGRMDIPLIVDPKLPNYGLYRGATVIKPNRMEAEQASGVQISDRSSAIVAGRELLRLWKCEQVLITLGEAGMVLVGAHDGDVVEIDTVARDVYDVSGAGDTVSAVFSLALAAGASSGQAAELANLAAGVVVAEVGTVAISQKKLLDAIARGV